MAKQRGQISWCDEQEHESAAHQIYSSATEQLSQHSPRQENRTHAAVTLTLRPLSQPHLAGKPASPPKKPATSLSPSPSLPHSLSLSVRAEQERTRPRD